MVNKPKAIGTQAETAVVRVLKDAGFRAKRLTLHGSSDVGDVDCGIDAVCIEVKGGKAAEQASDGQIEKWLQETETERVNAGANIGVLIVKRKGVGPANAGRWWAVMRHSDFMELCTWGLPAILCDFDTAPVRMHLEDILPYLRRVAT